MKLKTLHESAADFMQLVHGFLQEEWPDSHMFGNKLKVTVDGRLILLSSNEWGVVNIKIYDVPTGYLVFTGTVNLYEPGSLEQLKEHIRTPW